jgi:hypothetical protein
MTDLKEKVISKKRYGILIIANSIVWGVVIIVTSLVLRGTGLMGKLIPVLGGGAAFSNIIFGRLFKKEK